MLTNEQEYKIIALAQEIAKAITPIDELLTSLDISEEEWVYISKTKVFNDVLTNCSAEWNSATNTHKRAKLKAAAVIEKALPMFFNDMTSQHQKLADRAKVLEVISRVAGLGATDAAAVPTGNTFKLQINFAGQPAEPLTLYSQNNPELVEGLPHPELIEGQDEGKGQEEDEEL